MTKPKIYEQHEAAFKNVSAYVILKDGARLATIAFKFPKDGAGRLYAYVHYFGVEMARGHANGYGYDKKSAAVESAIDRLRSVHVGPGADKLGDFMHALNDIGGNTWDRALQDAGFTVFQAV